MNYDSVQAIIDAGTTNMTQLLSGSTRYDDNSYQISSIPSWIKYNNISATSIYASGNTWFGINSETEHIKFNRRDTAMYYLWVEEGTLYNYYHFYKLRWRGTNTWSGSTYYTWELIFFETGDLMIHLVESAYFDGYFNIVASTTYNYNAPTTENPYVSFYSQDENNSTFTIDYAIIQIDEPFDKKYLIKDVNNQYYTVVDGALEEITVTTLTASVFEEYGIDEAPDGDLLLDLDNPSILYWQDSDNPIPVKSLVASAIPNTQVITGPNVTFEEPIIETITGVDVDSSEDVLFAFSFDSGTTWKKFDDTNWVNVSSTTDGMSVTTTEAITTEQWSEVSSVPRQWKIRFVLFEDSYVNSVAIKYTEDEND